MKKRFNKIVIKFRDDLKKPEYRKQYKQLMATWGYLRGHGIQFRWDGNIPPRSWEYSHLLQKIKASDKVVLDFGGGNSLFAYHLATLGHKVFLVDIDESAIDLFNRNVRKLGLEKFAKGIIYEADKIPFPDEFFDLIISVSVIEHINSVIRIKLLEELRRILKKGKRLLVTFDYGKGARVWGEPFTSISQIYKGLIVPSGLKLEGNHFQKPKFNKKYGMPVKFVFPTKDNTELKIVEYSFGACSLKKSV